MIRLFNPPCPCCEECSNRCSYCTNSCDWPETFEVTISGIQSYDCDCSSLDGVYYCDWVSNCQNIYSEELDYDCYVPTFGLTYHFYRKNVTVHIISNYIQVTLAYLYTYPIYAFTNAWWVVFRKTVGSPLINCNDLFGDIPFMSCYNRYAPPLPYMCCPPGGSITCTIAKV